MLTEVPSAVWYAVGVALVTLIQSVTERKAISVDCLGTFFVPVMFKKTNYGAFDLLLFLFLPQQTMEKCRAVGSR